MISLLPLSGAANALSASALTSTALTSSGFASHVHPVWESFGAFEWFVVGGAALITAWSIWRCVHYTIYPGEREAEHIKHCILVDPPVLDVAYERASGAESALEINAAAHLQDGPPSPESGMEGVS